MDSISEYDQEVENEEVENESVISELGYRFSDEAGVWYPKARYAHEDAPILTVAQAQELGFMIRHREEMKS